jgi:hypothetical protein
MLFIAGMSIPLRFEELAGPAEGAGKSARIRAVALMAL